MINAALFVKFDVYMCKVLFIDVVHSVLKERLTTQGYDCIDVTRDTKEDVLLALKDACGVVIRSRFSLDKSVLSSAKELRFIARSGSGTENIDLNYCANQGIEVFSSPEGNRNAVAEHALGFLLALLNNFKRAQVEIESGLWERHTNSGRELSSCVVGIIGCGNNGLAFAQKLISLGVKVLVYDKYIKVNKAGVLQVELEELYNQVNVLSFHVPQTKETTFMGRRSFFSRFKKTLIVLNISRGCVIHTEGLVQAMKEGKIQKAALDVLEYETKSFESFFEKKLPEDFTYLRSNPNVILTPHVAGWSEESYFKLSNVLAEKIINMNPSKKDT